MVLLLVLAGTVAAMATMNPAWKSKYYQVRATVFRSLGIDPLPKQGPVQVVYKDGAAIPEQGGRPGYDPQRDPARPVFEEVVDLVNSFDWATDHLDRASARIAELEREHPDSPYLPLARAELLLRVANVASESVAGDVNALVARSLAVTRRIPDAYVMLAKIHLARNDVSRAQQEADRAYRLAPTRPEVLSVSARVAERSGRIEDAERLYQENLRQQKNEQRQSNVHLRLASMYQSLGPSYEKQANDAFLAAVALDPRAPWKLYEYGDFLLRTFADYEGASHYLRRAWEVMQHPRLGGALALAAYAKWADFHANKGKNFRPFDASSRPLDAQAASAAQLPGLAERTGLAPEDAFVAAADALPLGYVSEALLAAGVIRNVDHVLPGCECTALGSAAKVGNVALGRRLLARKANVDAESADGTTPLMRAAAFGQIEFVRLLLEHGARTNATARNGFAPIHARFWNKNDEVVALLLRYRADPDLAASGGGTLVCHSISERSKPLLEVLLAHRADPSRRCGNQVPLERALQYGWTDGARLLIDAGADANAVGANWLKFGERSPETVALIVAARSGTAASAAAPGGDAPRSDGK